MDVQIEQLALERGGFFLVGAMLRSPQEREHRGVFYQDRRAFPSDISGR